jgi:hypothetical protein
VKCLSQNINRWQLGQERIREAFCSSM